MTKNSCIQKLTKEIEQCKKCPLYKTRKNAVAGFGNTNSKILIVGEAPGKTEDKEKKPFAGRSGKLLTALLNSIDLLPENTYITNIVKCKPFPPKKPSATSISSCMPFLKQQLNILKPQIILALGSTAAKELLKMIDASFTKISEVHGKVFEKNTDFGLIKIIVFYHPAAALHNPALLSILKRDFKKRAFLINS